MTAQSSTESTQDAYQDGRAQRMVPWAQDGRGLYNSTDSLDSSKALNLALETAAAQRHAESQSDQAILASRAEEFSRGSRPSIGVQVTPSPPADPWGTGLRGPEAPAGSPLMWPAYGQSTRPPKDARIPSPSPHPRWALSGATGHPGSVETGYFDA